MLILTRGHRPRVFHGAENEVTASSPEDYTVETGAVWSEERERSTLRAIEHVQHCSCTQGTQSRISTVTECARMKRVA